VENWEFDWDKAKRQSNLIKHQLDFVDALRIFIEPHALGVGRTVGGETRELATGMILDRCVSVVFTRCEQSVRIISVRSARRDEKRKYQTILSS